MAEIFEDNFFELEKRAKWSDKVHGFTVDSKVEGGKGGVDNEPLQELADRTEFLKQEVDVIKGLSLGGYLDAKDFGSKTPNQQALTDYALLEIGINDHLQIWDGTRVKNLFDNNVWRLTNTPVTEPPIFEWINNGPESIVVNANTLQSKEPFLAVSGKRKIIIKEGTKIELVPGKVLNARRNIEIDVENELDTGVLTNGKDYYFHLCEGGNNVIVVPSLLKDAPTELNPADVKLLGGLHTVCEDYGTGMVYVEGGETKDHPLNGYAKKDILPPSLWDLNFRAFSENEGMSYISSLDFWCDIYLMSRYGKNTKSAFQGEITRNRQYVDFVEDLICVNKELLDDAEFAVAMLGSNEQTAVAGASEAGATTGGAGGRKDTAGRRMVSIYGIEEGCGSLWQFLRTTAAAGVAGSMYGQTDAAGTQGWLTLTTSSYGPNPQSGSKGFFWGLAGALLAGGDWSISAGCGSRARFANYSRSRSSSICSGRGRSRTR